jgi:hypothetical protein
MYTFTAIFIGLMVLHQAMQAQSNDSEGFLLVKRSGGITLYERWIDVPGVEDTRAREVKGVFYYNNSIQAALRLLQNEAKAKQWQDHVSEYRIYPQPDTAMWYAYSYHDIPWPVSDQDHFMEYRIASCEPGHMVINFRSKIDTALAPERKGVTRMELAGSWRLEQIAPQKVRATYRIYSMPLDIPRILTDPIVRSNMLSTIEDFVALVEQP